MLRLFAMFSILFPLTAGLAACATDAAPGPVTRMEMKEAATSSLSSEQNLAEMAMQNGVTPCPRFLTNLDIAEKTVAAEPKNYLHML